MKILVTGGCGFIGSHVTDAYIEHGYKVIVADLVSTNNLHYVNKSAEYVQIDLTDSEAVDKLIQKEKPNCINHHAANISLARSIEEPLFDAKNNITAIINILESMKRHGIPKIVFASSGGALYSHSSQLPFTEKSAEQPVSPYGASKLCAEKYIQVYAHLYGISFTILRYSNVYGPRQNTALNPVVAKFITKILQQSPVTVFNNGTQTRDFLYVHDLKSANLLATMYTTSDIFNISSATETSIKKLLDILSSITKSKPNIIYKNRTVKEQEQSVLSFKKAQKKLGWKPTTPLLEGLTETINWYEDLKVL